MRNNGPEAIVPHYQAAEEDTAIKTSLYAFIGLVKVWTGALQVSMQVKSKHTYSFDPKTEIHHNSRYEAIYHNPALQQIVTAV